MTGNAGTYLHRWFDRLAETGRTAEVFLDALAQDLAWTATGTSPISGTYHGRDAYIDGIYRRLNERLAGYGYRTVASGGGLLKGKVSAQAAVFARLKPGTGHRRPCLHGAEGGLA